MINKNYILFFVSLVIVFVFYNDIVFYKKTIKETFNNKNLNENIILNFSDYEKSFFVNKFLNNIKTNENNVLLNVKENIEKNKVFNNDLINIDNLNRITNSTLNITNEKNIAMNIILNKQNEFEKLWLNDKIKHFDIEKIKSSSEDKDFSLNTLKSSILYQYMNLDEKNVLFENEKNIYKRIELTNRYLMSIANSETKGEDHSISVFSPTQALGRYQINGSTSRSTLLTFLKKYNLNVNDIKNNDDFLLSSKDNKKINKINEYFIQKIEQKYFEIYNEKWTINYKNEYIKDMNTFLNRFVNELKDNNVSNNEETLLNFYIKYMTIFTRENETRIGQGVLSLITSENKMVVAKNLNHINKQSSPTEIVEKTRMFYNASNTKHIFASKVKKDFKNILNQKILNDKFLYSKKL